MEIRLRSAFRQKAADVLEIDLYSDVGPAGIDPRTGERREEGSAEAFRRELEAQPLAREIVLYVNSYGGDVKEGYGIYSLLRRHPAHKTAYVDGIAASIASVICMAADRVVMRPASVMMLHNMEMGVFGNAAALRKAADDLDSMMEGNRRIYLNKSGGKCSEETLRALLDKGATLTAQEALNLGLCDAIEDAQPVFPPSAAQREAAQALWRVLQPAPPRRLRFTAISKNEEEI